jgi:hypothetical protein
LISNNVTAVINRMFEYSFLVETLSVANRILTHTGKSLSAVAQNHSPLAIL